MFVKLAFVILFFGVFASNAGAEVIDSKKVIGKRFDVWNVSCEDDEMLSKIKCRMFVEITSGTVMFINPNNSSDKILFVSTDAYTDTKVYVRIDGEKLYESEPIIQNKYNIVKFQTPILKELYDMMRVGEYFFMRFTIKDTMSAVGHKEITVKIPLAEFQKAFVFFLNQRNKYDNINKK
ncbi:MAG: hypothetical protein LBB09_02425 [Rickettsiales bacterium]|nr:hypothetical protein [Rickettsiales bacterium]